MDYYTLFYWEDLMICRIAGLGVDVPETGDLAERCRPYEADLPVDIVISPDSLSPTRWSSLSADDNYYLESGFSFYHQLLRYDGMMLHASAVMLDGYTFLFSGPCGMGKSTHTHLWIDNFGDRAVIINDDKPALRRIDGKWFAFGTPWCGKDRINRNISAPLGGICFLHRGDTLLRRLPPRESLPQFLKQTVGLSTEKEAGLLMSLVDSLLTSIPVFELFNHADKSDALLTCQAMTDAIKERNGTL